MRSFLATLLSVLAAVLVAVGLLTVWVHDDVDSTERYVDAVAPLADDADVQNAVVDAVAGTTVDALQEEVPIGLPGGVETVVADVARRVVESDDFPELWREVNRVTHREFLTIVHGDDSVRDGAITVRLGPVVDIVLDRLAEEGLPTQLLPDLDPTLDLAANQTLGERRELYQRLDALGVWPLVAAGVLLLLVVALAHGGRGRLRAAAVTALLGAGAAGLVLLGRPVAVDRVEAAADPDSRDLVGALAEAVTTSLRDRAELVALALLAAGVVLLVLSLVPTGRRSPASA